MLTNLEIILVALSSVGGAMLACLLGYLESSGPFDSRKFISSMIRAVFAGMLFAIANYAVKNSLIPWDYLSALLGGAGIDVLGNRISGAVAERSKQEEKREERYCAP